MPPVRFFEQRVFVVQSKQLITELFEHFDNATECIPIVLYGKYSSELHNTDTET